MSTEFVMTDPFPARKMVTPPGQYAPNSGGTPGNDGTLAPWPTLDKYQNVIGSNLTLTYLSAVYRSCMTGYRREYVDVLDELIERDPHAYAVISQRIVGVAGGRLTMIPARCDDSEKERAREIADDCEQAVHGISQRSQALSGLLWGIFYGVSAAEINWELDGNKWTPTSLSWIHSRRLAYPEPGTWRVKIWDLGMMFGWGSKPVTGKEATQIGFGLAPDDFPGKFIIHAPQLRGDYPTRDGLGREMAYWMALKLMAARNLAAFVERFGKPWPIGYYNTTIEGKAHPRAATDDDKIALQSTLQNMGAGNLNAAALPDAVRVELGGPTANRLPPELPQTQLIRVCDSQISKAVLGQSDTTESGNNGSRSAAQVRKAGTIELYRYDAACLCQTLKRDLIAVYVRLNYPGEEHLTPTPHLDVEPPPDRLEESQIILNAVKAGAPIDADRAAQIMGVDLIPNVNKSKPRRLGFTIAADPSIFDQELPIPLAPNSWVATTKTTPGQPDQPDPAEGEAPAAEKKTPKEKT